MTTEARKSAAQTIRSSRHYRRVRHTRNAHDMILSNAYKIASWLANEVNHDKFGLSAAVESEAASIILDIIGRR